MVDNGSSYRSAPAPVQVAGLAIAGVFISLACLGFLPRLIRNVESLAAWAPAPESQLFGTFYVSAAHNVVHLLLGAGALVAAGTERRCRLFLAATGVAIILLVAYGQFAPDPQVPDLVPSEAADVWLHAMLGFTMLTASVLTPKRHRPRRTTG